MEPTASLYRSITVQIPGVWEHSHAICQWITSPLRNKPGLLLLEQQVIMSPELSIIGWVSFTKLTEWVSSFFNPSSPSGLEDTRTLNEQRAHALGVSPTAALTLPQSVPIDP